MESLVSSEISLNHEQASWVTAELRHIGKCIVAETLTAIEMLGLPKTQEEAAKKKVKSEIWHVLSQSDDWMWNEKTDKDARNQTRLPLSIPREVGESS